MTDSQAAQSPTPLQVVLVYGSYHQDRQGIRVIQLAEKAFQKAGHQVTVIDAKALQVPFLTQVFSQHPEGQAPENLTHIHTVFQRSQAFVLVTGEYNGLPQPGLLNLMDYFLSEYKGKPAVIISYSMGPRGGVRALAALGDFAHNVGLNVLEPALSIGRLHETLASDGTDLDGQYDVHSLIHALETAVRNHPQGIGESTP